MSRIWFEREALNYFGAAYIYKDYVLVNELYEDDDVRKNSWMWGKHENGYIVNAVLLEGLSSNSYAPWEEVQKKFHKCVDML